MESRRANRFVVRRPSAVARESQELPLIPFVDLGKRLVVARVKDGAVLEKVFGRHERRGSIA
jgi:hypothetical protein